LPPAATPDEDFSVFVDSQLFGVNDLRLEILQVFVIQGEAALERTVRKPSFTLEQL
jgi:hypothetical protein